ncbi:sensor histidine kinase [Luethyella okanaganae]|uniref:Sensor histidine kinase n=1 Tax=Luethyella okanaganae TaxID=69372 RepID=A0ABW1VA91_9MICO
MPSHLAESSMGHALARAAHWFGLACLGGALATVISLSIASSLGGLWATVPALLPMAGLLVMLTRRRTVLFSVLYLAVGGVCTFVYTTTILGQRHVFPTTDMFIVALPKMALVVVGGAGSGALIGVLWASAGLVIGEVAVAVAAWATGIPFKPDVVTLCTYAVLVGVLLFDGLNRRSARIAQPVVHRAACEDRVLTLRHELELRAAAHLHDTTLSHLIALAEAPPGRLDPRLRRAVEGDLESLVGQDWLISHNSVAVDEEASDRSAPGSVVGGGMSDPWTTSELFAAIEEVRDRGLVVEVTGDRRSVGLLATEQSVALGQAVRQCLVNVIRHAGAHEAEVSIGRAREDVVVLVVDAGRGFILAEAAQERLGLRHSVQHRIAAVGGSVEIWSRPGVGTSVMIVVPIDPAASRSGDHSDAPDRIGS